MEASEAVRRIFWRHRWLLLVLVLVPALVVVPLRERQPVLYAATAQVQGQNAAPDSSTQVTAIQSRITAAATSTALVRQAITVAGVSRDPVQVARRQVSVSPLGSSAVMLITVEDAQPSVAIGLAGALARAVVSNLNQLGTRYNPQLAALNANTQHLTTARDHLVRLLNSAQKAHQTTTSVKVQSLLAQLTSVEQQLSNNLSSVQQVLASIGGSTGVQLMSTPTYVTGVSRHAAAYGALAALLGLVLGLLFAIVREVIRPTVAEPGAGARELGVVLLGSAEAKKDELVSVEPGLAGHLNFAAQRLGARTIVLTGPVPPGRLSALARYVASQFPSESRLGNGAANGMSWASPPASLESQSASLASSPAGAFESPRQRTSAGHMPIKVVALPDINLTARPEGPALVVVLPRYAPHYALDRITDLGASTQWPVLGVIGLNRRRWWRRGSSMPRLAQSTPERPVVPPVAAGDPPPAKDHVHPTPSGADLAAVDGADQRGARA
jgi:hypothetical protein